MTPSKAFIKNAKEFGLPELRKNLRHLDLSFEDGIKKFWMLVNPFVPTLDEVLGAIVSCRDGVKCFDFAVLIELYAKKIGFDPIENDADVSMPYEELDALQRIFIQNNNEVFLYARCISEFSLELGVELTTKMHKNICMFEIMS
jgi:hypothetical protein